MASHRQGRAGIKDVARAAGVSITTVSHALNDKGRVQPGTRDRILAEAHRLGYTPNRRASGLRSGKSHSLCLVLPADGEAGRYRQLLALDFYQRLTTAIVQAAFDHGEAVLLLPPLLSAADLRQFDVDGGIVVDPTIHDHRLDLFAELGIPTVTVGRDLGRPEERWWTAGDNRTNVTTMLDHLAQQGARRIAMFSVASDVAWFIDAESAYEDWMVARNLTPRTVVVRPDRSGGPARSAATRLLQENDRPDAIYAPPYWLAAAVVQAAGGLGLRVPEDLMVSMGVDSHRAESDHPAITALDLQPQLMAAAAVEMLGARIDGVSADAVEAPRAIPGRLRIRESTTRPPPSPPTSDATPTVASSTVPAWTTEQRENKGPAEPVVDAKSFLI